jgi:Kef-type K+ transport system membrane component KefB
MFSLPQLLLQIIVILAAARSLGWLLRKIHQPQVIGEMVAGILLGPSLLGWLAPGLFAFLFPPDSLGFLSALSQIGLILFMFLVGLELDARLLRGQGHAAVITSHVSILFPFFLGAALALFLYPRLSDDSTVFTHFALFMGTAMSITAFPVLARILTERKMQQTKVGIMAIACAAVDDVTGWCILAGVVLLVRASDSATSLWITLVGTVLFITIMIFVVRRMLRRFETAFVRNGRVSNDMMALILLVVLFSALLTEELEIHAMFGAFLAGVIMPKQHRFVVTITEKLEDVAVVLLLPIFFALSGLRTRVGLLDSPEMWFYCALIILVAIMGKFGGSTVAARSTGMSWREAGAIGILMNTRGMIELVLLNIGLDIGVISPALFTMLVIMALVTTFMTSPILEWIYFSRLLPDEYPTPDRLEKGAATLPLDVR